MGEKIWTPSEMGKKGGKKSAESRLKGKTKEEKSEIMKKLRARRFPKHEFTKEEEKELTDSVERTVEAMNKATL